MSGKIGKNNTRKSYDTIWGNKPESTGERRKNKKIWPKGKTIQTKHNSLKQRKKTTTYKLWEITRKLTNKRMQERLNNFEVKYGDHKNVTKSRMDKQQSERVRRTRIMTKSGNTRRFTKNGTKKTICKTPGRDEMKFDIGKFAKLAMKNSKQHLMDGTELPNQDKISTLRG